ncbi:MAG: hypothetical protein KAW81_00150 [Dehalococcoidia bacterium]|nr:hypothetical protein [Dehalococcoidia bacterium]
MRWLKFDKVIIATSAVLLVTLPLFACAEEAPPPPAGTVAVEPAKVDQDMLKAVLPAVAVAVGLPKEAAPLLPPSLGILAIPVRLAGSGWPANEFVTIDLVLPAGVTVPGLESGVDSVGIACSTADADGNFDAELEAVAKLNWLLRTEWTGMKPDVTTLDPLPAGVYTIKAVGFHPETVATTTWELELVAPAAAE